MTIATPLEILAYRQLWLAQNSGKIDVLKSRVPRLNTRQLRIIHDMQGEPKTPTPLQKSADDVQYNVVADLELNLNDVFGDFFQASVQKIGPPQVAKGELSKSADTEADPNKVLRTMFPGFLQ